MSRKPMSKRLSAILALPYSCLPRSFLHVSPGITDSKVQNQHPLVMDIQRAPQSTPGKFNGFSCDGQAEQAYEMVSH